MTAAFQVSDVHYSYHDVPALRGLSLNIESGQRIALLGANGSGKSTLLRLLDALYFPDRGEIRAFGDSLSEERLQDEKVARAFRRRVGFVFQNPDVQLFNPTVFDEIAFGPLQMGWDKDEIRRAIDSVLLEFRIEHLRDRSPHRLSGGEKKRVALASVLVLNPGVLLLDEPTAALDPKSASEIVDFLSNCRGSGRTVVTATHDLTIVDVIADYCFVLQSGQIVASGTPDEILSNVSLLHSAHLAHVHRHAHGDGVMHAHQHFHGS
jgi:cobalt/nickel transport system ATP-binding protein